MGQAASKSVQLSLMESDGTPTPSGQMLDAHGGQQQSAPEADFDLEDLARRFIEHLRRVRRCSPRTIEAYEADYRKFIGRLTATRHDLDIRNISCADIERVVSSLSHLSSASIERFIYALRSLFGYVRRLEVLHRNPAADVQIPQKQQRLPRCFSARQVEELASACETLRERVVIALLRYCGLRRSELLNLDISDIAANCETLRVVGKGNKQRAVPLHPELQRLLREYIDQLDAVETGALIRNTCGRRLSPTSLYRLFHRLMERAGLESTDLTLHSFRHHFGSELAKAGVDVVTIAELMGHSSIQATCVYLHSDTPTKRNAIQVLSP